MITRLQVRNFKSIREIDVALGPVNVLVGPNMAGKSNILDALQFLYDVCFPRGGTQGILYAFAQRGGVSEVLWKGAEANVIRIALRGTGELRAGTDFLYELELVVGAGDFVTTQKESLSVFPSGPALFDLKQPASLILQQQGGAAALKNIDGKNVGMAGAGASALQFAQPNWDGYRLQQWIKRWHFYQLSPPEMKESSVMSLGGTLTEKGENLSAWLMWLQAHSPHAFARLTEVVSDLFPDVKQIRTIPTPDGKVHLAIDEKGLKRPINVWQTSDGFLILTALLSLIYVPAELSGTLFCIEEPENHLHPRILETLVSLLRQTRQEITDAGGSLSQILMTTQSPYFVDQFSIDEIVWVEKQKGETKAYRPADKADLRKHVEDREIGLGDLMYSGTLSQDK